VVIRIDEMIECLAVCHAQIAGTEAIEQDVDVIGAFPNLVRWLFWQVEQVGNDCQQPFNRHAPLSRALHEFAVNFAW